jgi:hypothetical protein
VILSGLPAPTRMPCRTRRFLRKTTRKVFEVSTSCEPCAALIRVCPAACTCMLEAARKYRLAICRCLDLNLVPEHKTVPEGCGTTRIAIVVCGARNSGEHEKGTRIGFVPLPPWMPSLRIVEAKGFSLRRPVPEFVRGCKGVAAQGEQPCDEHHP